MVDSSIKSQLQTAIQSVTNKSSETVAGNYASDIAAQRASAAQDAIGAKEAVVNARSKDLDTVLQKLNPPPTKDVSEGGKSGGSHTEVDQDEVRKLESQKSATQSQLNQAQSDVAQAREDAATASADALNQAGISKDLQSQMQSLMDQVNSIQDAVQQGKSVDPKDIKDITDKYNSIASQLTKDDNKSGIISKAFYDPFKDGLENILDGMNKQENTSASTNSEQNNTNTTQNTNTNTNT